MALRMRSRQAWCKVSASLAILTQVQHGTMDVSRLQGPGRAGFSSCWAAHSRADWEERRTLGIRQALLHHVGSAYVLQACDVVVLLLIRVIVPCGG